MCLSISTQNLKYLIPNYSTSTYVTFYHRTKDSYSYFELHSFNSPSAHSQSQYTMLM